MGQVKNNILFGQSFEEAKYLKVLEACDLLSDLQLLSNGDETIIGDRGINLSGGQRARIGLARAVYYDADVYLLDDPLSAVDPKVGNTLFTRTICTALAGKTRILVTHQVQFLSSSSVSRVAVLNAGSMTALDTYESLKSGGYLDWISSNEADEVQDKVVDLIDYVPEVAFNASNGGKRTIYNRQHSTQYLSLNIEQSPTSTVGRKKMSEKIRSRSASADGMDSNPHTEDRMGLSSGVNGDLPEYTMIRSGDESEEDVPFTSADMGVEMKEVELVDVSSEKIASYEAKGDETEGIIVAEDRNMGTVTREAYRKYFLAMGGYIAVAFGMLLMATGQASAMYCTVWLAYWSRLSEEQQDVTKYRNIYIGLVAFCCIISIARSLIAFVVTI